MLFKLKFYVYSRLEIFIKFGDANLVHMFTLDKINQN